MDQTKAEAFAALIEKMRFQFSDREAIADALESLNNRLIAIESMIVPPAQPVAEPVQAADTNVGA